MSYGQLIPFIKKTRPRNLPRSWECPITGEHVINTVHVSGSHCWSTIGKPLQIIPAADGWRAVYRYETEVVMLPIVCWVLTEFCDGTCAVVGWVADGKYLDRADSDSVEGFDGYIGPGCELPKVDAPHSVDPALARR